jgi:hypothetical protein
LIDAVVKLAETVKNTSITVSRSRKEADAAIGILNQIGKILNDTPYVENIKERINRSITNYVSLKDKEIINCIKNIPSKDQLLGKEHIGAKDDVDLKEWEAKKPVWENKEDDMLRNIRISTTVQEYIKKHKDRLGELYEIMNEKEVVSLLTAGRRYYPIASSIDEVVDNIIQNLRTWKKREITLSGEESFKKEKSIVNMLVEARKKLKTFSEHYKNYYEALYNEISVVDPEAVIPNKGHKVFSEMRNALLKSKDGNQSYAIHKNALTNPLLSIEVLIQNKSRI